MIVLFTTMNNEKIAYLLAFVLLFGVAFFAQAAENNNRYLIKSGSGVWKKYFGARHSFDNGFTADLSDFQIRFAKIFGLEIEQVTKLYILPAQTDLSANDVLAEAKPNKVTKTQRAVPVEQVPWGIKAVYGDSFLADVSGGEGVTVAILDTGAAKSHLDIENRIKDCKDFSSPKSPVVDGKCEDKNGHGTHVAGIIAADGGSDGLGIFGVAPDANLFVYQVCSVSGSCWADDIAVAVKLAADNGANIINISLGSDTPSLLIGNAVSYAAEKGVLIVAASGNDGPYAGSIDYPAADPKIIGVGALDVNQLVSDWSSSGINSETTPYVTEEGDIEFAAPGVSIESTWKDGGYAILSGTSMAAPHISGLAAKLWQKDSLHPAEATRNLLHQFSKDLLPSGDDDDSGWGLPTL